MHPEGGGAAEIDIHRTDLFSPVCDENPTVHTVMNSCLRGTSNFNLQLNVNQIPSRISNLTLNLHFG